MPCPELIDRRLGKWTVYRLNAHQLMPLGIYVGLERTAVRRRHQQQGPWITWAQNDLVHALPGHLV